jgi:hypothetical protein
LPEYLANKYGKLAVRQIYQEMGQVTDIVETVTEIKRLTPNQQKQLEDFLSARQQMLPGFIPKYRIEGDN